MCHIKTFPQQGKNNMHHFHHIQSFRFPIQISTASMALLLTHRYFAYSNNWKSTSMNFLNLQTSGGKSRGLKSGSSRIEEILLGTLLNNHLYRSIRSPSDELSTSKCRICTRIEVFSEPSSIFWSFAWLLGIFCPAADCNNSRLLSIDPNGSSRYLEALCNN